MADIKEYLTKKENNIEAGKPEFNHEAHMAKMIECAKEIMSATTLDEAKKIASKMLSEEQFEKNAVELGEDKETDGLYDRIMKA